MRLLPMEFLLCVALCVFLAVIIVIGIDAARSMEPKREVYCQRVPGNVPGGDFKYRGVK